MPRRNSDSGVWERPREYLDYPSHSSNLAVPPSFAQLWARFLRTARFSGIRLSPLRFYWLLSASLCLLLLRHYIYHDPKTMVELRKQATINIYPSHIIEKVAFQPPESMVYRDPDSVDTFEGYKHRDACNISSLDLHTPFSPLCPNRGAMLTAMSSGGRIGFDAPYMPRGCDMRWFTSEEICEVLERFSRVVIIGDSMLRHLTGSINILVRRDIGYGAVTDWNFGEQEKRDCFCNEQFDVKACSVQGIYKTADVMASDPTSVSCKKPINIIMEEIVRTPAPIEELTRLQLSIGPYSPLPKAFILGHGLWSDLSIPKTISWLDTMLHIISSQVGPSFPALFVTPNAAGKQKSDEWLVSQGNKALMLYEERIGNEAMARGVEHLGTWNMSIQARKYDGVHLDLRGNLVKAMMVVNWLSLLDV